MRGSAGRAASGTKRKIGVFIVVFLVSISNVSVSSSRGKEKGQETGELVQNPEDEELFRKYGWTITRQVNSFNSILPSTFIHEAGEFPVKLYWAYHNELSKGIGLDFSPYLGQEVRTAIYALSEPWPVAKRPDVPPYRARGVAIRAGLRVIGAYIQSYYYAYDCSLDRKLLAEVTKRSWEDWIDSFIDYANETEKRLSTMRPEEIISEYFGALDRHDGTLARACRTRRYLMIDLIDQSDDRHLYKEDFDGWNLKSAKLISVQELPHLAKINPPGTIEYEVKCDCTFKDSVTRGDGVNYFYMLMRKETARGGWRINSVGTGP